MNEKETLKKLIENPKQPDISEWVYAVEAFLKEPLNCFSSILMAEQFKDCITGLYICSYVKAVSAENIIATNI